MGQIAGGYCRNQFRFFAATVNFHGIFTANRHVGKLSIRVLDQRHVIGNRTGIERGKNMERRLAAHDLRFPGIFEGKPDFIAVVTDTQVWRERTGLRDTGNDLVTLCVHNVEFRSET